MNGAWILPSGKMINTTNVFNHEYSLISTGIDKYILDDITFSKNEYLMQLNNDIRYKAFKSGFVRVITVYNQIAIECLLSTLQENNIKSLFSIIENYMLNHEIKDIVLEDALTNKPVFFNKINELKIYLENVISGQYIK